MELIEFEGKLMGGQITIALYGMPKEVAQPLFSDAYKEGLRLQKIFNFYDKDSELSRLNCKRKMKVSKEMLLVLEAALKYCSITKGAYDISIGKQIMERKSKKELTPLKCSYKDIKVNSKEREVTLTHEDVLVDLGSIAKGYIGDWIGEFLKKSGAESFFIDARGDMLAYGEYEEKVVIQHPREKEKQIRQFVLKNAAVATSGDYLQFYGDYKKSHIIGQKELISVTVVAPTLMEADAFASAVFLLEKKEREELIKENPNFKVFTIDEKLNELEYNGFEDFFIE